MAPIVAVTGVTGKQGKATVEALLKEHPGKFHIRCVVRSPDALKGAFPEGSVEIVQGDMMDRASLAKAFAGAEKVFCVTAVARDRVERETEMGVNAVDAAIEAGVKFFLFTSVGGLTDDYCGIHYWNTKIDIARHLKKAAPAHGMKFAILKPCMFFDNWNDPGNSLVKSTDTEIVNAYPGRVRMRFVAVRDIGWFAAHMLANSEQYYGKELELASQILSYDEAAAEFAKFTGRRFIHRRADPSQLPMRPGVGQAKGSSKNLIFSADPEALRKIHPGMLKLDRWLREEWNGRDIFLESKM
ncbi:hypothetical protein DFJ74DRAFT_686693 [Hyaloraphidium curvatum]|nr:hypothetical protein DFJ74DRAFT_686693 [Hyaloraphidium curvatum]